MAQLKDLIVSGAARVLGKLYASEFVGKLTGNADTSTKATQDSAGQQINTTYIKGLSVNGRTITYTKGNNTTGTITTQDTNTDTKVTQTAIKSSDYTNWRTIPWGSSNSGSEGFTPTTVTDVMYSDPNLTYQPATGTLRAKVFKGSLSGNAASASSVAWGNVSGKPSTYPPASHTHNYAGSSSAGGNANAAVKLATARSINGTNFDGSANITTANWGTARTITVGNTGKSVNGSGNVSWSLGEIGVHVSNKQPAASEGKNGDVWIVYEG